MADQLRVAISGVANNICDPEVVKNIAAYATKAGDDIEQLTNLHKAAQKKFDDLKAVVVGQIDAKLKELDDNATGIKVGEYLATAKTIQRFKDILAAVEKKVAAKATQATA